ncbi:hypothetical protein [uncultured Erythrobacter sp.]|uniref:hypothetical protein n=1 Tax=uncultured Erythrobacter sp. TaxID=263913 RepID=UPI0026335ABE|nr:hypothetical protein [uncultured Erythrobacter sp.]
MTIDTPSLTDEMRAALGWWQLAGVDSDFADEVTDWLKSAGSSQAANSVSGAPVIREVQHGLSSPQDAQPEPIAPKRVDLLGPNAPTTLSEFQEWWLSAPGLDAIGPRGRVAPRGPQGAELMVLVIDPEQGDKERLLSGPQGRLLSRIISAMGLAEDSIYLASALPRHTPMADTATLSATGMDEVTQFHVNHVNPQRLLAFGAGIPPLLGHTLTNDLSHLREINRKPSSIPLFVTEGLDAMMAMPRLKARFWRRWIEWSAKE